MVSTAESSRREEMGLLNHEDCCYPSARGQQVMADLLFETGLLPVR
jgi:hypothetical protein